MHINKSVHKPSQFHIIKLLKKLSTNVNASFLNTFFPYYTLMNKQNPINWFLRFAEFHSVIKDMQLHNVYICFGLVISQTKCKPVVKTIEQYSLTTCNLKAIYMYMYENSGTFE